MRQIYDMLFTGVGAAALVFTLSCGGTSEPPSSAVRVDSLPELPERVVGAELPRGEPRLPVDIRIALVGEVRGELEPCGCPTLPYGGFARRSTLLDRLRAEGPIFHLDAGELLLKGFATDRSRDKQSRAEALLKLSDQVGVDLWVPGPTDLLMLGPSTLVSMSGPRRLSASYTDTAGRLLLAPSAVLERGGVRLGVVGLSAPPMDSDLKALVHTLDPVEAARSALKTLPEDLDLIIALGNISDEVASRVGREVVGLAAVLTVRGGAYDTPEPARASTAAAAPVIEAPDRGRYLQVLSLRVGGPPGQAALVHPEARAWRERAASGDDGPFETIGRGRNLIGIATIPLAKDLDGATVGRVGVDGTLDAFKARSLAKAAQQAKQPPSPPQEHYAASGGCVHCHSSEFARWSLSAHAQAWMALVKREETGNPECLPCHTTAWAEPTGLGELSPSGIRKFKSVQCESCHGPMGGHPQDTRVHSRPISQETCTGCHDEANSPDFDFERYRPQASCQGGSPLTEAAP
jgi:hypothetical protein